MVYIKNRTESDNSDNNYVCMTDAVKLGCQMRSISQAFEAMMGGVPQEIEQVWQVTTRYLFQLAYALDHKIGVSELDNINDDDVLKLLLKIQDNLEIEREKND